jgi:hypothetical protein
MSERMRAYAVSPMVPDVGASASISRLVLGLLDHPTAKRNSRPPDFGQCIRYSYIRGMEKYMTISIPPIDLVFTRDNKSASTSRLTSEAFQGGFP